MSKGSLIYNCFRKGFAVATPFLLYLVFSTSGCGTKQEFSGTELVVAPDDFEVFENSFEVSPKSVNLEREDVSFKAEFNHRVSWRIRLKGLTSGAEKMIKGVDDHINADLVRWDGGHDELYFFKKDENVAVELSFMGSKLVKRDTIKISAAKLFSPPGTRSSIMLSNDDNRNSREGFEGIFNFNSATWTFGPYPDPGEQIFFGQDKMERDNHPPVQGEFALTLHGNDRNDDYFVTGIKRALTNQEIERMPSDPDSVYINIYIYGRGHAATKMNVSCEEADDGGSEHIENKHDAWEHQLSFDHRGWKLFSIRYSDLTRSANPDYGGNGNGRREPQYLRGVGFNLVSSPPGNEVKATFDFPIITFGKPFNPK
ncbi:hypothetical protein RCC89_18655 [Cytophagaceae bacterium ABcell3]|nr:hypothetical protein RCC89_18655 [Cytophagaceae bacterium ABcell3]